MIVALSGHVDHGKTSLIKALTGVDTDRLAEERRRGLTIDLGFAYERRGEAQGGGVLGLVDVPGHHRFIHNMVAGVAAQQFALLVVDAGDGPMPQTREHLQILSLNGLSRGLVALTKCDRVNDAQAKEAEAKVRACVRGGFLENAPIHRTSAATGTGIAELKQALWAAADNAAKVQAEGQFRLAIDRAFNMHGAGLVVTGTVHAGRAAQNDELYIFPSGDKVRVRGLRVQDQAAETAAIGDRAAVNLAGGSLRQVRRGCWLTERPVPLRRNFVVDLKILEDFPRPVRHWLPVHVHHATSRSTARLALLRTTKALPGSCQEAEIITDEPLCARHGDAVVLRDQGQDLTLGGGMVLTDLEPSTLRRRDPARLAPIRAFKSASRHDLIAALLGQGTIRPQQLQNTLGLTDAELRQGLSAFELVVLGDEAVLQAQWSDWQRQALQLVAEHQAKHPNAPGATAKALPSSVPARFLVRLLNELVGEKRLQRTAGTYHLPTHVAQIPKEEQALFDRLRHHLDQDQAPSVGDLTKVLGLPLPRLNDGLNSLARRGLLVQVSAKRFYQPDRLTSIAQQVDALAAKEPLTVRRFRDSTGIGRNVAIELLEYFDGRGFTRRSGDTRTVVGPLKLR